MAKKIIECQSYRRETVKTLASEPINGFAFSYSNTSVQTKSSLPKRVHI